MACWSFCFHLILFGLAESCGETPVWPGKVVMNYWSLTASSKCHVVHFLAFLLFFFFFFLKPLDFTESWQQHVCVVQTCFTNWDKYMDVREGKKENLDVQVLTHLAREHKQTEGRKCVLCGNLHQTLKNAWRTQGFFFLSLDTERRQTVPRTPGENTVQIMWGRGEQIREKAVCGFQAYKAIPPLTPRWGSSKRTKPEVPICWVLFNRWARARRVYPERTGAAASKQNYLRMVTYSFFPHAWKRHALCLCSARTVVWCWRIQNGGHASLIVLGVTALGVSVVFFANLCNHIKTNSDVAHETLSKQI